MPLKVSLLLVLTFFVSTDSPMCAGKKRVVYDVRITQPARDGVAVGKEIDVIGRAVSPSGNHLWGLVHRKDFSLFWWPQGEAMVDPKTHEFRARAVFGGSQDIGHEFEIAIITVNDTEHVKIQAYWEKAMQTQNWPPMKMPPTTSAPQIRSVKKTSHD